MKIVTVRYRRLQSHDRGYGHDAVEAEAEVGQYETPEEALKALRGWVNSHLSGVRLEDSVVEKIDDLDGRLRTRERSLERMNEEIEGAKKALRISEKLRALAQAAGIGSDELNVLFGDDDIPF